MVSNSSPFQSFFSDVPLQWVLYGLYATHLRRASLVTRDVTVMWQVLVLDGTHRKDGDGNAEEGKCWSGEGVCDGRFSYIWDSSCDSFVVGTGRPQ